MHTNAMHLHKQIVEGRLRNFVQTCSICIGWVYCAASDQVAESYDMARATLATKVATMSTEKLNPQTLCGALTKLNKESFISGTLTTPEPRLQHSKLEMPFEGAAILEATSLHFAPTAYQKKCSSARVMINDISIRVLPLYPLPKFILHLLQGTENVSAEFAAVIFNLRDHRDLQ